MLTEPHHCACAADCETIALDQIPIPFTMTGLQGVAKISAVACGVSICV